MMSQVKDISAVLGTFKIVWKYSYAAYLSDAKREAYVTRALKHLNDFFINEQTKMNPHFRYS
jgi:hypothetical protein